MSGNGSGNQQSKDNASRRGRRRKGAKKAAPNPLDFWGDPERLPRDEPTTRIISDPAAVVRSLGRPPLSGQQNHADTFFGAVYQRSVTLASVLAAAGNLIEPEELVADRNNHD